MTEDKSKFLKVTDSSCTAENPERRHHIKVRGELLEIVFRLGESVILPFEHAIKFMIDGFKVEEADGRPVDLPAVASEGVKATLAADEVIAKLSELTVASLKVRAGQKIGGEVYLDADDSARDDIIAFLLGKPPAGAEEPKVETVDDETDLVEDEGEGDDANGGAGLASGAPAPIAANDADSTLGTLENPSLPPVPTGAATVVLVSTDEKVDDFDVGAPGNASAGADSTEAPTEAGADASEDVEAEDEGEHTDGTDGPDTRPATENDDDLK